MFDLKPGIYEGIPHAEYLTWPAVSKSALTDFAGEGPGGYKWRRENGGKKQTRDMLLGTAADVLIFDGRDDFYERFAIKPQGMKFTTSDGKLWQAEHAHKEIISWDEAADIFGAVKSLTEYDLARKYMDDSRAQLSLLWEDPDTGLLMKARPDFKPNLEHVLGDLKTTKDTHPKRFSKVAGNLRYHWQAAIYSDGWEILTGEEIELFVFATVQMSAPYRSEVYSFEPKDIQKGRDQYKIELDIFAECKASNHWPLSTGEMQIIDLGSWA